MSRKKKVRSENTTGTWLNTYADMITLVLTFFILLYAISSVDSDKWIKLVEALSNGKNVISAPENLPSGDEMIDSGSIEDTPVIEDENNEGLDILYKMILEYVKENNLEEDVTVMKTEDDVFIRFRNNVFFDGYKSELKDSGKRILDVLSEGIQQADSIIQEIIIAGHTAVVETDTTNIDRTLSSDRANAVLNYMESKNIFDPAKLVSIGYGLYRPIATNDTAEGRAQNRRVEIYITKKTIEKSLFEDIYDKLNKRENNMNSNENESKDDTGNSADN